jgi:Fe-S cluster biogenesis protein NfuA
LDDVHASLNVEGCDVSIASLEDSRLRLGITHGARACSSTMTAVQHAIETTLFDLVPELTEITFEDRNLRASAVIPLDGLRHGGMAMAGAPHEVRA